MFDKLSNFYDIKNTRLTMAAPKTALRFLISTVLYTVAECNHMLGATASWKVYEYNQNFKVQYSAQVFQHGSFSWPGTYVSLADVPFNESVNFLDVNKVDFDTSEDWYISQSFAYTEKRIPTRRLSSGQKNCCWASNIYGYKVDWSIPFDIDLTVRDDIGKPNTSPVALQLPILTFYVGCPEAINIPTMDEDGDIVTCRFGNVALETGSVRNNYPYISLNERPCQILYNGGGYEESVPVSIIVEDHKPQEDDNGFRSGDFEQAAFSYIPLQFLIQITKTPVGYCPTRSLMIPPTPAKGTIFPMDSLTSTTIILMARPPATSKISRFNVMGIPGVNRSSVVRLSNGDYKSDLTLPPLTEYRGLYLFCVTATDNYGITSEPHCFKLLVEYGGPTCGSDNAGCSDTCNVGLTDQPSLICSCDRSCWELSDDQKTCIPNVEMSCGSSIDISVENCAADGAIGIGGYADDNINDVPIECRPIDSGALTTFSFQADQCNTIRKENSVEVRYENTVQIWVVDPTQDVPDDNSTITRGLWYNVPLACRIPKYVSVNGTFFPEDNVVEIGTIEGMGDYTVTFDFYKDDTFERTFSPYDYPVVFKLDSDIFFGMVAEVKPQTDGLELLTVSCNAYPDPNLGNIAPLVMIKDGCLLDTTMVKYNSEDPMKNFFSIEAFRFKYGLEGIDSNTNVIIKCEVMICVKEESENCIALQTSCPNSRNNDAQLTNMDSLSVIGRTDVLNNYDDSDSVSPTRDPNVTESDIIEMPNSFWVRVAEEEAPPSNTGPSTSIGVIVGATLGAIVVLLLIALIGMIVTKSQTNQVTPDDKKSDFDSGVLRPPTAASSATSEA